MNSLMSMRTMAFSSSNMNSARARASSVFPTPRGPQEDEAANGTVGVSEARVGAAQGVRNHLQGVVLADHAAVVRQHNRTRNEPIGFRWRGGLLFKHYPE